MIAYQLNTSFSLLVSIFSFLIKGIYQLNFDKILSRNPHFKTLNNEQAQFIIASIPKLGDVVTEKGRLIETKEYDGIRH
jgi:hypothetical protein